MIFIDHLLVAFFLSFNRGNQRQFSLALGWFTIAGLSTDQRLKLLNSWPALDPGAYAQAANQKKTRKLMAGTPQKMEVDGRCFFFHFFSFSNWGIFRFHVIHVVRFRVYVRSFQTWKRRALLIIPGEFLLRFDTAKSCWPRDLLLNFPIDPKLGDLLGQRISTMMSNMVKKLLQEKTAGSHHVQPMISVNTFLILKLVEHLHDLGLIPDSRVYIFCSSW